MRGYRRSNTCPALSRPHHREHVIARKLSEIYSSDAYDTHSLQRRPSTTSLVSEESDVKWLLNETGLESKDDASLMSSNMSCGTEESNLKWLLKDANSECQLDDPIHPSIDNLSYIHSSTSFLAPNSNNSLDSTAIIMYIRQRKKLHSSFKKMEVLSLGEFFSLPPRLYHAMKVVQFLLTSYYYVVIYPVTKGEELTTVTSKLLLQNFATMKGNYPKHMVSCCLRLQQFVQKYQWTVKNAFDTFSWSILKPFFQSPSTFLLLNFIAKDTNFASQFPNALRRYLIRLVSVDIFRLKSHLERMHLSERMVNYVFAVTAHIHDIAMQRGNFGNSRHISLLKSRLTDMHFKSLVSTAAAKYVCIATVGTAEDHALFTAAQTLVGAYDKLQLLVPLINTPSSASEEAASVFLTATEELFPLKLSDISEYYSSIFTTDGAPPYRDFVTIAAPPGGWGKRNNSLLHMITTRAKALSEFPSIIVMDTIVASEMLRTLNLHQAALAILSPSYITHNVAPFNPSLSLDLFSSSILTSSIPSSSPLCYAIGICDATTEEFDFVRNYLLRPADTLLLLHVPVDAPAKKRGVTFADTAVGNNTIDAVVTELDEAVPACSTDTVDDTDAEVPTQIPPHQYYTSRGYNIITIPMHCKASVAEHLTTASLEGGADILIIGQSKRKPGSNVHQRLSVKITELAVTKDLSVLLLPTRK